MGKIVKALPWSPEGETHGLHIDGVCEERFELDYYVKTPAGDVHLHRVVLVSTDDLGQKYVFLPRLREPPVTPSV